MFVDIILNYGWLTFGNEVAKSYNAWLEDPDTVERVDNEKKGWKNKKVPASTMARKPSSYQLPPEGGAPSDNDIEKFVQKNQMGQQQQVPPVPQQRPPVPPQRQSIQRPVPPQLQQRR